MSCFQYTFEEGECGVQPWRPSDISIFNIFPVESTLCSIFAKNVDPDQMVSESDLDQHFHLVCKSEGLNYCNLIGW